jgi:hypothetical protein
MKEKKSKKNERHKNVHKYSWVVCFAQVMTQLGDLFLCTTIVSYYKVVETCSHR